MVPFPSSPIPLCLLVPVLVRAGVLAGWILVQALRTRPRTRHSQQCQQMIGLNIVPFLLSLVDPYTIHDNCIPPDFEDKITFSIKPHNPRSSWFWGPKVALAGAIPVEITLRNAGRKDFRQAAITVLPASKAALAPFIQTTLLLSGTPAKERGPHAYTVDLPIDANDQTPLPKYIMFQVRLKEFRSKPVCFAFTQATNDFGPNRCDKLTEDVKVDVTKSASVLGVTLHNTGPSTFIKGSLSFTEENGFYRPTVAATGRLEPFSTTTFKLRRQQRSGADVMELHDAYDYKLRMQELDQEYPRCRKVRIRENATTWAAEHSVLGSLEAKAKEIKRQKKGTVATIMVLGQVGLGKSFFIQSAYTLFSKETAPKRFDVMTCSKAESCTCNITRHVIKSASGRHDLFVLADTWGLDVRHDMIKELPLLLNGSMPDGWHYSSEQPIPAPDHATAYSRRIDAVLLFVSSSLVTSSGPPPQQIKLLTRLLSVVENANVMPLVVVTQLTSVWPQEHASDPVTAPSESIHALKDKASTRLGIDAHHVYLMPTYLHDDHTVRSIAREKMTYAIVNAALGACMRRVRADSVGGGPPSADLRLFGIWMTVVVIGLTVYVLLKVDTRAGMQDAVCKILCRVSMWLKTLYSPDGVSMSTVCTETLDGVSMSTECTETLADSAEEAHETDKSIGPGSNGCITRTEPPRRSMISKRAVPINET